MELNEEALLLKKWHDVLEEESLPKINSLEVRKVVARLLENTEQHSRIAAGFGQSPTLLSEAAVPVNATGAGVAGFDPIMISLVRRTAPNNIGFNLCGVQPMSGPTGIVFALRSRYTNQTSTETFYNEVNTAFSTVVGNANTIGDKHVGTVPAASNNAANGAYNYAAAMSTAQAEALGTTSNAAFAEMAFSIEKVTVTAKSRALAAGYTLELAQDLQALHGLSAEGELSNILQQEILAEQNREIIRTINVIAQQGASSGTTTAGIFDLDTDSNGRWMEEKFKGLMFQLDLESNQIAKNTRRGRANWVLCSSDVASALQAAGKLSYAPAIQGNNLVVDDTGNTYVGKLNGKWDVYIDPYVSGGNYMTLGYKGAQSWDAGLFFCPYVPLQMVRAVDRDAFTPRIGFKTRYGITANPYALGTTAISSPADGLVKDSNVYFRRVIVSNIM